MAYRPDLNQILIPGARYADYELDAYVVEERPLGDLVSPTGQVVACEPWYDVDVDNPIYYDMQPFTVTARPGIYPVYAWVAVIHRDDTELGRVVAALQLSISDDRAVRWELGLRGTRTCRCSARTRPSDTPWKAAGAPWPTGPPSAP